MEWPCGSYTGPNRLRHEIVYQTLITFAGGHRRRRLKPEPAGRPPADWRISHWSFTWPVDGDGCVLVDGLGETVVVLSVE